MTDCPSVSILFVTKNGERYLGAILRRIQEQQGNFRLAEIIAVDSGSRDQTLSILEEHAVRIMRIPAQTFGHGRTRNLAASYARGDYLVFLTQDATPANTNWLDKLLAPLLVDPLIAGAYSRHVPRPSCHPMEWRRIVQEELSGMRDSRTNSLVDNPVYARNPAFYYFFTNVSSVIRHHIWSQIPLPEVEFGEDQLWAKKVLEAGYKTAYCADSVVYHSHGYGPWANFRRHFDHTAALRQEAGPLMQSCLITCLQTAVRHARTDLAFWAQEQRRPKARVVCRWALPALGWHCAAQLGVWFGERAQTLPEWLQARFSHQAYIKRQ